ncbi:MAG: hypothetical protein RL375_4450 [Pseudomonadota bacterium]
MSAYEVFIGINYSGLADSTTALADLQVYAVRVGAPRCEPWGCPGGTPGWSRAEVAKLLVTLAERRVRFVAGISHAFSLPAAYFKRHDLADWPALLDDFACHWPTHEPGVEVDALRARLVVPEPVVDAARRVGKSAEYRLTERWTSSAKSVFDFSGAAVQARATHAGLPWLKQLREQAAQTLHVWPFDGWRPAPGKALLAEVYPAMLRNRYARGQRTAPQQHAYAVARWLADMDGRGALASYLAPPLNTVERGVAEREGWILGVN